MSYLIRHYVLKRNAGYIFNLFVADLGRYDMKITINPGLVRLSVPNEDREHVIAAPAKANKICSQFSRNNCFTDERKMSPFVRLLTPCLGT